MEENEFSPKIDINEEELLGKPKHPKFLKVLLIISLIVIVLLIGVIIYLLFLTKKKKNQKKNQNLNIHHMILIIFLEQNIQIFLMMKMV
jgi:flagellar basal body-associated protein FliL